MPNLIEITDMTGVYAIPKDNFTTNKFDPIRDEYQFELIYRMLGQELGQLFIDDLDASGVPVTVRFLDIYNAFVDQDGTDIIESKGIKDMVLGYVYYFYVRENNLVVGLSGNKTSSGQNSEINKTVTWMVRRYNLAITTYYAIQWYIEQNLDTYPEYKGDTVDFASIY